MSPTKSAGESRLICSSTYGFAGSPVLDLQQSRLVLVRQLVGGRATPVVEKSRSNHTRVSRVRSKDSIEAVSSRDDAPIPQKTANHIGCSLCSAADLKQPSRENFLIIAGRR